MLLVVKGLQHILRENFKGDFQKIRVALFLYETEDKEFKGSLRVNGNVNVAKVASHFGGGGHIKAAGFSISKPYDLAIPMILDVIKEQL